MASCPDPVVRNHAASRGRTGAGTRALRASAVEGIVTVEPRERAAPTRARRAAPEVTAAAHAARATDSGQSGFVRVLELSKSGSLRRGPKGARVFRKFDEVAHGCAVPRLEEQNRGD